MHVSKFEKRIPGYNSEVRSVVIPWGVIVSSPSGLQVINVVEVEVFK